MVKVAVLGGGISGLATAYAVQEKARAEGLKVDIVLIEKEKRLGGKIESFREESFLCEGGPSGFLNSKPETLKLASDVGLSVLPSTAAAKKRFIYVGGRLRRVPEGPSAFIRSDILSIPGKLRILLEPFTKPSKAEDETVAGFGRRHLGREAEERLVSAMIVGIYAGSSEKLSLKSSFPVMAELESEGGGSLIRAMFKRMKAAKKAGKKRKASASPTGSLTSFEGGMADIIHGIEQGLDAEFITGKKVSSLKIRGGGGYEIHFDGEKTPLEADVVAIALPAYVSAEVLGGLDKDFKDVLGEIPYAPAAVVCLGYREEDLPSRLEGYGFLVPPVEGRKILGCRWDSSTFEGRAPPGHVLVEVIVGGSIQPELAALERSSVINIVKDELKAILGIEKEPVFSKVIWHEKAIPQYVVGHNKVLEKLDSIIENYPGLFITGNAYHGIGVNDCTKNALVTADKIIGFLKESGL
ncbi:MAG TPA: protoporphyrinogen oxidase [Euryarchaeota archaeon]|nr:protoporphyrinogen oxidase [Euryarchaeota archaeon]